MDKRALRTYEEDIKVALGRIDAWRDGIMYALEQIGVQGDVVRTNLTYLAKGTHDLGMQVDGMVNGLSREEIEEVLGGQAEATRDG